MTDLTVRLRLVSANSGRPLAGATVRVWDCEKDFGSRRTDESGWAEFDGAFPEARPGDWPHLHFQAEGAESRLALPRDACQSAYGGRSPSRADLDAGVRKGGPLAMASVTGDPRRGFVATRTLTI
jgi:hypothetical protein